MKVAMKKRWMKLMLLTVIIGLGATFRLSVSNWDSNTHLHPDERFLTMVAQDLKLEPLDRYLDAKNSRLNPANAGYDFYVYGVWPLIVTKVVAGWFAMETYNGITLVGRNLSALVDLAVVGLVWLMAALLAKRFRWGTLMPFWAAFSYALMALPIQLSHFFAVDTFLTLFITASAVSALGNGAKSWWVKGGLAGAFWGMAVATKISAVFGLPLILLWLLVNPEKEGIKQYLKKASWLLLSFGAMAYLTTRFAAPTYFESRSWLNPLPSRDFTQDLIVLKSYENPEGWFPPGVQWLNKPPVLYALVNFAFFGLGMPLFWLIITGIIFMIFHLVKKSGKERWVLVSLLIWMGGFFLYQSSQLVKALRYFYFLYPFLAVVAGFGWQKIWELSTTKATRVGLSLALLVLLLIWPLAFMSIYWHEQSRVSASQWIYRNIPEGSVLLSEHWDDALPLILPKEDFSQYRIEQLPVFEWDTPEKWKKMDELLAKGDYLILSSNRGWGSMPTVPKKYREMTQFYHRLLTGQSEYQLIKEFSSYPSLKYLGVPLTLGDDWADETFTVYDHPKVMIFQRL